MAALRKAVAVTLVLGVGYATVLSAMQIGKAENKGAAEALAGLVVDMDGEDLLSLDTDNARGFNIVEIKTALLYSFGVQVITTDQASLMDPGYIDALDSRFDDVYLVSSSSQAPDEFDFQALGALPSQRPQAGRENSSWKPSMVPGRNFRTSSSVPPLACNPGKRSFVLIGGPRCDGLAEERMEYARALGRMVNRE